MFKFKICFLSLLLLLQSFSSYAVILTVINVSDYQPISVEMEPTETIGDLKLKLENMTGILDYQQDIIINGINQNGSRYTIDNLPNSTTINQLINDTTIRYIFMRDARIKQPQPKINKEFE